MAIRDEFNRANYGSAIIENEEDLFEFIKKNNLFGRLKYNDLIDVSYSIGSTNRIFLTIEQSSNL